MNISVCDYFDSSYKPIRPGPSSCSCWFKPLSPINNGWLSGCASSLSPIYRCLGLSTVALNVFCISITEEDWECRATRPFELKERGFNRFKHLLIIIWTGWNCIDTKNKEKRYSYVASSRKYVTLCKLINCKSLVFVDANAFTFTLTALFMFLPVSCFFCTPTTIGDYCCWRIVI